MPRKLQSSPGYHGYTCEQCSTVENPVGMWTKMRKVRKGREYLRLWCPQCDTRISVWGEGAASGSGPPPLIVGRNPLDKAICSDAEWEAGALGLKVAWDTGQMMDATQ